MPQKVKIGLKVDLGGVTKPQNGLAQHSTEEPAVAAVLLLSRVV